MATIPATSCAYAGRPPVVFASSTTSLGSMPLLARMSGVCSIQPLASLLNSSVLDAYRGPSTGPGVTQFTVAFSESSRAHTRVIPSMADLVPPYTACPTKPQWAEIDETLIIRPERSLGRYGWTACTSIKGAKTLIRNVVSNSDALMSGSLLLRAIPATLSRMSIWKGLFGSSSVKYFLIAFTRSAGPVGLARSPRTSKALMPYVDCSAMERSSAAGADSGTK